MLASSDVAVAQRSVPSATLELIVRTNQSEPLGDVTGRVSRTPPPRSTGAVDGAGFLISRLAASGASGYGWTSTVIAQRVATLPSGHRSVEVRTLSGGE